MLYIVYIAVQRQAHDSWYRWMVDSHIDDVIATGCFLGATMVRDSDADSDEFLAYRIIYRADSVEAFDRYQANFGDELRRDHTERFGEVTRARRELLDVVRFY